MSDSLTTIGEGALDGLTGLKKLVIQCDPAIASNLRFTKPIASVLVEYAAQQFGY